MKLDDIWDILEIAPTTDAQRIKSAYAAQSRKYHPEEDPETWQRVNEAYRAALEYVKWANYRDAAGTIAVPVAPPRSQAPVAPPPEPEEEPEPVPEGNRFDFDRLEEEEPEPVPEGNRFDFDRLETEVRRSDAVEDALRRVRELLASFFGRNELWRWDELFASPEFLQVKDDPAFLDGFAEMLRAESGNLWPKTQEKLFAFFHFEEYADESDADAYTKLFRILRNALTRSAQEEPFRREEERNDRRRSVWRVLAIVGLFAGFFIVPLLTYWVGLLVLWVARTSSLLALAVLLGVVGVIVFLIRLLIRLFEARRG
jgi:hypothetical protein